MTLTGWSVSNDELSEHGAAAQGLGAYLSSGDFWEAISENWESEFLQMGSYVVLTIFLFQKGSSESKPIDRPAPQDEDPRQHREDPNAPWPVRRGGVVLRLYENSLLILFAVLFAASVRHPRDQWGRRLQPGAAVARCGSGDSAGVPGHLAVLVRVVPELAVRVHGRRAVDRRCRLPPPARIQRIQTRPCAPRKTGTE